MSREQTLPLTGGQQKPIVQSKKPTGSHVRMLGITTWTYPREYVFQYKQCLLKHKDDEIEWYNSSMEVYAEILHRGNKTDVICLSIIQLRQRTEN